jgi:hypothetical protein
MSGQLSQSVHYAIGLNAVANAFAGTVYSDVVNAKGYSKIQFLVHNGVGTTGTSTITVLAGDDTTDPPSNSTAIPFRYKAMTTTDTEGAFTTATTAGFTTTAGSNDLYVIEVDCSEIGDTGYNYCCLKCVESAADPVLGGILILMYGGRYQQDVPATAIT